MLRRIAGLISLNVCLILATTAAAQALSLGCLEILPKYSETLENPFYRVLDLDTGQITDTKPNGEIGIIAPSPDNTFIVYSHQESSDTALYLKELKASLQPDRGILLRSGVTEPVGVITGWVRGALYAMWSPDSQRIAYHWPQHDRESDSIKDTVVVADSDGNTLAERTLTLPAESFFTLVGFSGRYLLGLTEYKSGNPILMVWLRDTLEPATNHIELASDECYRDDKGELVCVQWSSNNEWAAYTIRSDTDKSIVVLNNFEYGKQYSLPIPVNNKINALLWSPDGERIAIIYNDARRSETPYSDAYINIYNINGHKEADRLPTSVMWDSSYDVEWLNNGQTLFYIQQFGEQTAGSDEWDETDFRLLAFQVNTKQSITLVEDTALAFVYADPERREFHGKYLVTRWADKNGQVVTGVIDTSTGEVTVDVAGWQKVQWLPSDYVLIETDDSGIEKVLWFRSDGKQQGEIEGVDLLFISSTPDGQILFFEPRFQANELATLQSLNLTTGEFKSLYQIDQEKFGYTRMIPSLDNHSLAYLIGQTNETQVKFIDVNDAKVISISIEPPLPQDVMISSYPHVAWSADSSRFAIAHPYEEHLTIYVTNTEGALLKILNFPYNDAEKAYPPLFWNMRWTDCP